MFPPAACMLTPMVASTPLAEAIIEETHTSPLKAANWFPVPPIVSVVKMKSLPFF
jgi:hypothetical protein